jgi:nitronate monooxygenase
MATFLERLGLRLPIIQAPMAGVSTPQLAAAVCNAGALGSLALGASTPAQARAMIADLRTLTDRPFAVNVFVHEQPQAKPEHDAAWLAQLAPHFHKFGAKPPSSLREIYTSFNHDDEMLAVLLEAAPPVISFHFGLPSAERIAQLKATGAMLIASATSVAEGLALQQAGFDAVIAQGYEAGGHRGIFDPNAPDDCLSSHVLTRILVQQLTIPVIAAGGIMDGAGIAAALKLGAVAAQLGTAFIACPESQAAPAYRQALLNAPSTVITNAISGRPARCIVNRFTAFGQQHADLARPDYPLAYDAGKALHAAASAHGEFGYGAFWAGQGASLARAMPAQQLVASLAHELQTAL